MAETFTKLMGSITASTVWSEPYATRIAWVTMLAMADKDGNVYAAVPGLARHANITMPECQAALAAFMAPDPYSRTPDHEGRRIEPIDGGWRLLNWGKYRGVRDVEARKEYQRQWDREHRPSGHARQQSDSPTAVRQSDSSPTENDKSDPPDQIQTKPEQEQRTKAPRASAPPPRPDDVAEQVWSDWLDLRRKKRAPVTGTVLKMARHEAGKAKLTLNQFLAVWCFRGSQGLEASWLTQHDLARARGITPQDAPSKTLTAIQKLQGMRQTDETRALDPERDSGRSVPLGLSQPGSDAGG